MKKGKAKMMGSASEDASKDHHNSGQGIKILTPSFASPSVKPFSQADQRGQLVKEEPKGEDVKISRNIRSVSRPHDRLSRRTGTHIRKEKWHQSHHKLNVKLKPPSRRGMKCEQAKNKGESKRLKSK